MLVSFIYKPILYDFCFIDLYYLCQLKVFDDCVMTYKTKHF